MQCFRPGVRSEEWPIPSPATVLISVAIHNCQQPGLDSVHQSRSRYLDISNLRDHDTMTWCIANIAFHGRIAAQEKLFVGGGALFNKKERPQRMWKFCKFSKDNMGKASI